MSDILTKPTLPTFSWIGHLKDDDRELLSSYGEFFPGHPGIVIIEEGAMQTQVIVVITGKLEVPRLISDRYPLERVADAFAVLDRGEGMKLAIVPDRAQALEAA